MKKNRQKTVKRKPITEETKRNAVLEYHNTGNASATARRFGVARTTLLSWIPVYTDIAIHNERLTTASVQAIERTSLAVVDSIRQASATRQEFYQQHFHEVSILFSQLLQGMSSKLDNTQNPPSLRDQAAALTALTNFVKEFLPAEDQGTTTINLLQQTINNQ